MNCGHGPSQHVWYEYNGIPLKWHYPVGALFDLYGSRKDLPFRITVRFQGLPKVILPCKDNSTVETVYFSALKQGLYLKLGSTEAVRDLPVAKQTQLWEAVSTGNFETFWPLWCSMFPSLSGNTVAQAREQRCFAIRVLTNQGEQGAVKCVQKPIPFQSDIVLGELLDSVLTGIDAKWREHYENGKLLVAGIVPPLDAPVQQLCTLLEHPDSFLYISLNV